MRVYTDKVIFLINELKELSRELILNHYPNLIHEKKIAIFFSTDVKNLGKYTHSNRPVITLSEELIDEDFSVLKDVFKHELAHFITSHLYPGVKDHGIEFRMVCSKIGTGPKAKEKIKNLRERVSKTKTEKDKVVEKVKKLLKLGESSNQNEAELALSRANALINEHNISFDINDKSKVLYSESLYTTSRMSTKYKVICQILESFNVFACTNSYYVNVGGKLKKERSLEISGDKNNVEVASYAFDFLDKEMDKLWKRAKKENGLDGRNGKNSFYRGFAKGFESKINKTEVTIEDTNSLDIYKKNLEKSALELIYIGKRHSKTRSRYRHNAEAFASGKSAGKKTSITNGIKNTNNQKLLAT